MDIFVKFTKSTHQIWSRHVILASNSEKFYFSPNSIFNYRKSYQLRDKLAQEQKIQAKKQLGMETPPLPVLVGLMLI